MIAKGEARAVHHIESPAMCSLSKACQARDIDVLVAIVSVIKGHEDKQSAGEMESQFSLGASLNLPQLVAVLKGEI